MRLTHSSIQPVGTPVRFRFDGRELEGIEGETLAAALSAAGIVAYRQTLSGAPRGQFCGMGACFDCVVTVDGRAGRRACLEKLVEGMVVGGAGLEPLARTPEGVDAPERIVDVLVVGAGPAGLAAGLAAAEAGASVVVLDERSAAGGQYHKPLAPSHRDSDPDGQFREGAALRGRAVSAGVEIVTGATVWGAFSADEVAAVVDGVAVTFRPKKLILAPGAHERPVPVPGWTLPGVMTTGGLQTLARAQRVAPGERIVIAGNGPLNLQLACELAAGGATVVLVVEAAARPGLRALRHLVGMARHSPGLMRQGLGYLASLRRFGVPIRWGSRAEAVLGQVEADVHLFQQHLPLPLGHAPGHHHAPHAAGLLQRQHLADDAERFLPGRFDEAAGVDDDDIGAVGVGLEGVAVLGEFAEHPLGIDEVLRAPEADEGVAPLHGGRRGDVRRGGHQRQGFRFDLGGHAVPSEWKRPAHNGRGPCGESEFQKAF